MHPDFSITGKDIQDKYTTSTTGRQPASQSKLDCSSSIVHAGSESRTLTTSEVSPTAADIWPTKQVCIKSIYTQSTQ